MKLKKFKFTKKAIVVLAVAALIVVFAIYASSIRAKSKNIHTNISTTALKKTDLKNTVSVSGTIHSDDTHNVYTTLTLPVKAVHVSVGDKVKKGQVLAELDTSTLEKDIEQQEYTVADTKQSAAVALAQAKRTYENTLNLYNQGLDSDVVTAQAALKTASDTYNYKKLLYENGQASKSEFDQAKSDYDKAQKSLTLAQNQAGQKLKTDKEAYDSAVAKANDKSADISLEKLKQNLKDSVITAPTDGTITTKNISIGAVPAGVLFVISNTDNLVVDTQIKEIDAATVKAGEPVSFQTDATGDATLKGTVASIDPAATSATEGTGNVTYSAKISISDKSPSLRIGMKARMDIVLQEKKNIYVVSYDTLLQKGSGNAILVAEKNGALYKVKKIPVTTGLETDVSVEISGSGLKDGMLVISNPDGISPGDTVQLTGGTKK